MLIVCEHCDRDFHNGIAAARRAGWINVYKLRQVDDWWDAIGCCPECAKKGIETKDEESPTLFT